jgi:hypothetical protein
MADEKKDAPDNGEGQLYRVETVPPPAGEDDAYSAPTKVGPVGDAFVQNLMKEAEQRNAALARKDDAKPASEKKPAADGAPSSKRPNVEPSPVSKPPVSAGGTELPRIYDEEEEDAATKLSPKAKPPVIPQKPMNLQVPTEAPAPPSSPRAAPVAPPPVDLLKQYASNVPPSSSPAPVSGGVPSSPLASPDSQAPELRPRRGRTIALFLLLLVLVAITALLWSKQRHF